METRHFPLVMLSAHQKKKIIEKKGKNLLVFFKEFVDLLLFKSFFSTTRKKFLLKRKLI